MNVKFPKKKFKSARSVKNYIGSNYKSHTDFLIKNGFIVDKCIFCERYADTIVEIKEDKENWYIDSFVYYRGNKVCRDKNCVCSSLNPQSKEWLVKVKGFSEDDVKKKLEKKAKKSGKKLNGKQVTLEDVQQLELDTNEAEEKLGNLLNKKSKLGEPTEVNLTLAKEKFEKDLEDLKKKKVKIETELVNESLDNKRTDVNFITTDTTNDNCSTGYKVPEAFTWGDNGEKQLTGYWLSKYQLSE